MNDETPDTAAGAGESAGEVTAVEPQADDQAQAGEASEVDAAGYARAEDEPEPDEAPAIVSSSSTDAHTMARSAETASSKRYEESSRSGEVSPFEAGQPDYPPVLEPGDAGYPTTSDPHSSAPVEHGAPPPE